MIPVARHTVQGAAYSLDIGHIGGLRLSSSFNDRIRIISAILARGGLDGRHLVERICGQRQFDQFHTGGSHLIRLPERGSASTSRSKGTQESNYVSNDLPSEGINDKRGTCYALPPSRAVQAGHVDSREKQVT